MLTRIIFASLIVSTTLGFEFPDCSPETDGHYPHNGTLGPFGVSWVFTSGVYMDFFLFY